MKRYAKYKDSGVEWIGEIPEGWGLVRIKIIAKIHNGSTPKDKPEFWDGEIKWITPTDIGKIKNEKFIHSTFRTITKIGLKSCGCELSPPNSIVITNRGPIGNVIIPTFEYTTNQGCKALLPTPMHNTIFLYYQLKNWSAELENLGQGTTFKELSTTSLKNFIITTPPLKEQEQIVEYLDNKTQIIDRLVASKEKKISLLKEQRTSIINQVITKGLNPNAKMKDSGVEWIGEIPEGWGVKKLKHLCEIVYGISPPDTTYNDEGIGVELVNGPVEYSNTDFGYTRSIKWTSDPKKFCKKGSLLFCLRGSTTGRMNIAHKDIAIGRGVCSINSHSNQWFMIYSMFIVRIYIQKLISGSTFPSVVKDDVDNYQICNPPLKEQEQIVEYLDNKTREIDNLVQLEQKKIDLLKEYRQSLISEVVLGKIKVSADE